LAWLDQCDQQLADKTVIDYGCGSGILSIAALSLGAAMVYGIDHDDQALIATRDNARRNGIDPQRLVVSPPQDLDLAFTADILLANILAAPLIELAPRLAGHTKVGGQLVLAGILADQAEAVMVAYRPWFADIGISGAQDEWVRLTASKGSV
jgi:ribosomal protein L11 methyltransferase